MKKWFRSFLFKSMGLKLCHLCQTAFKPDLNCIKLGTGDPKKYCGACRDKGGEIDRKAEELESNLSYIKRHPEELSKVVKKLRKAEFKKEQASRKAWASAGIGTSQLSMAAQQQGAQYAPGMFGYPGKIVDL